MVKQLISTGQLNQVRRLRQRMMPDQVAILVPGELVPDGHGGTTQTFTEGLTVKCSFRPSTQRADTVEGGQGGNRELFVFSLPVRTVVGDDYRLRRNGIDYEVVGTATDAAHDLSVRVLARKL